MDEDGTGTDDKRIVLLRDAAKELVETLAKQAAQMKQVEEPVQFAWCRFQRRSTSLQTSTTSPGGHDGYFACPP